MPLPSYLYLRLERARLLHQGHEYLIVVDGLFGVRVQNLDLRRHVVEVATVLLNLKIKLRL